MPQGVGVQVPPRARLSASRTTAAIRPRLDRPPVFGFLVSVFGFLFGMGANRIVSVDLKTRPYNVHI